MDRNRGSLKHEEGKIPQKLSDFLEQTAFRAGYFGSITIRIQNGVFQNVKIEATKKLEELDDIRL